jgi:enoyl-CoA hydratase
VRSAEIKENAGGATMDELLVEIENGIATITINRPDRRNALTLGMWSSFPSIMAPLSADPAVKVVVLRGSGDKAFSAGGDIPEFLELASSPEKAREEYPIIQAALGSIEQSPKPVIAMIRGFAMGGAWLLISACDIRIAAEDAQFSIPSARIGVTISYPDTLRTVRLIGPAKTKEILYTARLIKAAQAYEWGLVNHVVPVAELEKFTYDMATVICSNAPLSVRGAKQTVNVCVADPMLSSIKRGDELAVACILSKDFSEGVRAFIEKRPPKFAGT